jgi:choline dehydrogenase-like flavoprotein
MAEQQADYIIIEGGAAGCVLAFCLAQYRPDLSILLLEAGPDEHSNPLMTLPFNTPKIRHTPLEWSRHTKPQVHLDNRQLYNCTGKLLSGSSAINHGSWTRGPKADYDLWAEVVGDQRWSYAGMLPFFRRTESHHDPSGDKEQHGFSGPIHTQKGRAYPLRETVKGAFEGIGLKEVEDANGGDPRGLAMWTENFREGRRQPAGAAYDLSRVRVATEALARRVLIEGKMVATGAELVDGRKLMARKEVIASCGAIRMPQVLMLSGIGPAEQLEMIGTKQLLNSPEVGRNFWDHCSMMQYWKVRSPE